MRFLKKIDRVLAAFGNIKALERTHVDTFTENLIKNIEGKKIAESHDGQLWVEFKELAGYNFMESIILSRINIKTWDGSTLSFIEKDTNLILSSDNTHIESDYSNVSNTYITKISFIVTKDEINYIKNRQASLLVFKCKRKSISFKIIK